MLTCIYRNLPCTCGFLFCIKNDVQAAHAPFKEEEKYAVWIIDQAESDKLVFFLILILK
jgi:hypothetical protein